MSNKTKEQCHECGKTIDEVQAALGCNDCYQRRQSDAGENSDEYDKFDETFFYYLQTKLNSFDHKYRTANTESARAYHKGKRDGLQFAIDEMNKEILAFELMNGGEQ